MRPLAVALAAVLAACGGSRSSTSTENNVTVTGALGGTFSNASGIVASGACNPPEAAGVTVGGGVAAVGLSSSTADLCQAVQQGRRFASSTTVGITALKLNAIGQAQTLTPGAYTVVDLSTGSLPAPDANGSFLLASVSVTKSGTSAGAGLGCSVAAESSATSGTVTITGVSGTIAGTVTATLASNAGTVNGTFNAPVCSGTYTLDPTTCAPTIPAETSCQ